MKYLIIMRFAECCTLLLEPNFVTDIGYIIECEANVELYTGLTQEKHYITQQIFFSSKKSRTSTVPLPSESANFGFLRVSIPRRRFFSNAKSITSICPSDLEATLANLAKSRLTVLPYILIIREV